MLGHRFIKLAFFSSLLVSFLVFLPHEVLLDRIQLLASSTLRGVGASSRNAVLARLDHTGAHTGVGRSCHD